MTIASNSTRKQEYRGAADVDERPRPQISARRAVLQPAGQIDHARQPRRRGRQTESIDDVLDAPHTHEPLQHLRVRTECVSPERQPRDQHLSSTDVFIEQLEDLARDDQAGVLADVVALCENPGGKHPLSDRLAGWNTQTTLNGTHRIIYRATPNPGPSASAEIRA